MRENEKEKKERKKNENKIKKIERGVGGVKEMNGTYHG